MSKYTTDLREQIYSILDSYSDAIISTDYAPKSNARPKAIERIEQLISNREKLARIDELENLQKLHTRTYHQKVTDNMGEVYVDDTHAYISKYETQERIATLRKELDREQSNIKEIE